MDLLLLSIGQLLCGGFLVGVCLLIWCLAYSWFAANRDDYDTYYAPSRSSTSWDTDHEFFDMITEYRDDFA